MYSPLKTSKVSGISGAKTIIGGVGPKAIEAKFARMVTVSRMPSHRWPCLIHFCKIKVAPKKKHP